MKENEKTRMETGLTIRQTSSWEQEITLPRILFIRVNTMIRAIRMTNMVSVQMLWQMHF